MDEAWGTRTEKHMAKLSYAARKKLPTSVFALPGRRYPMPDRAHAANAKARVSAHGTPEEKAIVNAKANRILHG
jgi:hypothetical protein